MKEKDGFIEGQLKVLINLDRRNAASRTFKKYARRHFPCVKIFKIYRFWRGLGLQNLPSPSRAILRTSFYLLSLLRLL